MPQVSIIIVHYRSQQSLVACLQSLQQAKTNVSFEVIVVDNDLDKRFKKQVGKFVHLKFPLKIIKNKSNTGFGAGNNIGAKAANGEYLFFLNPDTIVRDQVLDKLVYFLQENSDVAVVAPTLLDNNQQPYPLQGSGRLTPLSLIGAHSLLHRWWPNNPVAKKFWQLNLDHQQDRQVSVVPGSAFLIRTEVFMDVGQFDENFFLYFEDTDLCRRIESAGWKLFMLADAKVIHYWGVSTKHLGLSTKDIYRQSRDYYFKKHYGFIISMLLEFI